VPSPPAWLAPSRPWASEEWGHGVHVLEVEGKLPGKLPGLRVWTVHVKKHFMEASGCWCCVVVRFFSRTAAQTGIVGSRGSGSAPHLS